MDIGKEYLSMCEKSQRFDVKKGLSETCCYRKLYGDLVEIVPHYQEKFIWKEPSHGGLAFTCIGAGGGSSGGNGYGAGKLND